MKAKTNKRSWEHLDKVANIGENYVMYKLATLGIRSQKMLVFNDYDLLAGNGARIEVKTSTIQAVVDKRRKKHYKRKFWAFTNNIEKWKFDKGKISKSYYKRDRECDFFALVCLNNQFKIIKCFIVPKTFVGTKAVITIPLVNKKFNKRSVKDYEEKWDLIKEFTSIVQKFNKTKGDLKGK